MIYPTQIQCAIGDLNDFQNEMFEATESDCWSDCLLAIADYCLKRDGLPTENAGSFEHTKTCHPGLFHENAPEPMLLDNIMTFCSVPEKIAYAATGSYQLAHGSVLANLTQLLGRRTNEPLSSLTGAFNLIAQELNKKPDSPALEPTGLEIKA